ncbi:RING-H2 finger protein ATL68-like [Oryza brachyantha]|uniref:RING-type domain-containing protein n=1 Tax=Oryza brachyantha TaxID=4533 RepID=J3M0K0_ORYBR|nr:RING-H2 finger protein ATL68-like [Oryza brachyantha]
MLGPGLNLVSAALGFGMTAAFVAFVCARFVCCRPRRADARASRPHPSPLDFEADFPSDFDRPVEHSHSGLGPLAVAAIPTMKYNCETFHSEDDTQCSICLSEYKEKDILRIVPTCHHNFHLYCLDAWLLKQTTCPICRISLRELPGGKAAISSARSISQPPTLPESSVNPTPQFLPVHQDHIGHQDGPDTTESVEVVIEIRR